jgi:hypothetical protein
MGVIVDRIGQKFGRLTVVALAPGRAPNGSAVWIFVQKAVSFTANSSATEARDE